MHYIPSRVCESSTAIATPTNQGSMQVVVFELLVAALSSGAATERLCALPPTKVHFFATCHVCKGCFASTANRREEQPCSSRLRQVRGFVSKKTSSPRRELHERFGGPGFWELSSIAPVKSLQGVRLDFGNAETRVVK